MVQTNILAKYIIKSILEKRLRTALIIASIAVSAALYFASSNISDTMVKIQSDRWRAGVGYTDLMVQAWWESPSRYFNPENIRDMEEYFDYAIGSVSGYGQYRISERSSLGFNLWGIDYDDLNKISKIDLIKESGIYPFGGKKIIISNITANKLKLQVGDTIPLNINGVKQKFMVCGITEATGPFLGDGESVCGVIPPDTLRSLYNIRGKVDTLYIKLKHPANKLQIMRLLSKRYQQYNVREPFTEKEIRIQNNKVKMPFMVLTIILSFMSIYIINSTFTVITYERMPDIGTFRSIGARKKNINRMLLIESLLYGSAGGLLGCLIGIGVLYLMSIFTMPSWEGGYKAAISFQPVQLMITFVMALLLCLISSIRPILKVNKIPVKDIVLNTVDSTKSSKILRTITGLLLICFGSLAPILVKGRYSIYINAFCSVTVIAALVMLIPFFMKHIIKVLEWVYSLFFGNEGTIAVKNLRENRSVNGSISLLAIGISCALFVNILSYSSLQELLNYYNRSNYQIFMQAKNVDMAYLQAIRSTQGVKNVTKVMGIGGIDLLNKNDILGLTEGVDIDEFLQYHDLQITTDPQYYHVMDQGRGIMVTNRLKNRFDLKLGEELKLRAWGKITDYIVVGFFDSIHNNGNYAIISDKYMKLDMDWNDNYYSNILIKTDGDPDKVLMNLKNRFAKQNPYIKTLSQLKKDDIRYNEQLFLIAKGFSIVTMLAGILGILNNLIINYLKRRRHLAMYRSVGMSKGQLIKMIFVEAFSMGFIGSVVGILSGMLMILSGAGLLKSLEMDTKIHYSGSQLVLCLVTGILICVIASIWPALRSSKLNLMEAIKYE